MECLHTVIETTGNAPWEVLEALLPSVDLWLYDLKHMDSETHRRATGVGNELILANLRKLAASDAAVRVRVPLIPTLSATEENLRATAQFVAGLGNGVREIDLLPLHHFGRAKYESLGRDYPAEFNPPTDAEARAAAELIKSYDLVVQVVGREAQSQ
jgi:pyruvate formate lyase activating enzyme